ncbi:TOMM precursor leader peptide-binding protein [Solihabitans fulvus]|uniref:TOMM leader peptide-binding protein n=1 Tax=Solihabitans fulvus TaxID=1892852 RepID=A0A5B2XI03_9PSEU|nr:TOMM precursor leader peptide-binding protein [Solihabitans fulvus]KAA2262824.1 TOMM precursor leader peptide-binding protein [Solihabitans fulvus]
MSITTIAKPTRTTKRPPSATKRPPSARPSLPRRPRVLPGLVVLRRRPDEVQLGTDPRHAMVVDGLSPPLVAELCALDGRHTVDELVARATARGEDTADVLDLLADLVRAGLVDEAPPSRPHGQPTAIGRLSADSTTWALRTGQPTSRVPVAREQTTIVVHGNGRLAVAVGALFAAAGVGRVQLVADGLVRQEDTGCGYLDTDVGRPRREAADDALRRASGVVRLGSQTPHYPPSLAVLTDAIVPCPQLVAALVADRVPHLAVRVREGVGLVGPLVLPGRTSCLRCADLHRCDLDPCWSTVAAQLADRPQPADLATAQATAGLAVAQALLALSWPATDQELPPTWNATLELDPLRGVLERRPWLPHPHCDCGANACHDGLRDAE